MAKLKDLLTNQQTARLAEIKREADRRQVAKFAEQEQYLTEQKKQRRQQQKS